MLAMYELELHHERILRAEERLRILRDLAELGLRLARRLVSDNGRYSDAPVPSSNCAEAFARVSRAVRLTLTLEAKLDDELAALRAGPVTVAPFAEPGRKASPGRRDQIRERVRDVIDREVAADHEAAETFADFNERLFDSERYDGFLDLPFEDAIAAICKDLGLPSDWKPERSGERSGETILNPLSTPPRTQTLARSDYSFPTGPQIKVSLPVSSYLPPHDP